MTGRRLSHFGDRLRFLPKGVAIGGCAGCARAHAARVGRRCLLKSPRRILLSISGTLVFFNFRGSARTVHTPSCGGGGRRTSPDLRESAEDAFGRAQNAPFCVFLRIPRARAEMRGNPLILCSPRTRAHDAHVFGATVLNRSARI